jgi:hypothetical protein
MQMISLASDVLLHVLAATSRFVFEKSVRRRRTEV